MNPGPATTTDTVKMAQIVPDICPREKEFADLMRKLRSDLLKVVHADPQEYTAVLFCGSGTINIDVCINSLLPQGKSVLIVNNGAYSSRAVEICQYYGLPYINLEFPVDQVPDLSKIEEALAQNPDIALVHTTHNETGTGILNPIRKIGALAHRFGAVFSVDNAPDPYRGREHRLLYGVCAEGADGNDGAIFYHWKEKVYQAVQRLPETFLLLQFIFTVRLF